MAILHAAQLSPSKPELIAAWMLAAPYYSGGAPTLTPVGAYRFDDPAGEVGIETHLVRDADGTIYQVPLTYRSAPLAGARLAGEMEHSVLGHRYVYDATTDPSTCSSCSRRSTAVAVRWNSTSRSRAPSRG